MKGYPFPMVLFAIALSAPAQAEGDAAPVLSGNLSLVSDYLFRGLSQSGRDPALQGGIEYGRIDGWYLGAWGSSVSWLSDYSRLGQDVSNSVELDVYAGWRLPLGADWKLDLGLYSYYYPGDYPRGFTRPHTTEGYVGLSWTFLSLKYSHSFTNLFGFRDSKRSGYLDLSANWEFMPGWALNAHVGRQRVRHSGAADYTDWKLGLTRSFANGIAVALGYYDTDADEAAYTNGYDEYLGRRTGVLSVSKVF